MKILRYFVAYWKPSKNWTLPNGMSVEDITKVESTQNTLQATTSQLSNCPKDAFLAIAWFEGVELLESHDGHSGTWAFLRLKFQKSK